MPIQFTYKITDFYFKSLVEEILHKNNLKFVQFRPPETGESYLPIQRDRSGWNTMSPAKKITQENINRAHNAMADTSAPSELFGQIEMAIGAHDIPKIIVSPRINSDADTNPNSWSAVITPSDVYSKKVLENAPFLLKTQGHRIIAFRKPSTNEIFISNTGYIETMVDNSTLEQTGRRLIIEKSNKIIGWD